MSQCQSPSRVCLVSGGTGGHLMPALVLARALRECGGEPLLVTEGRAVERELLRRELPDVPEEGLPPLGRRWALPLWLFQATRRAGELLRRHAIDAVVSTGGRPSLPVGLAARRAGLPLYLLEQNAITGRANRWLLRHARRVYHGLPPLQSHGERSLLTGTPLRPEFARADRAASREALGLPGDATVVLVTGGSQGASALNEVVPQALLALGRPLHVLHLAGAGRDEAVRRSYARDDAPLAARVRPVALDMDRMFAAADLVVCRGGGTTVAELAMVGRPAIIVPYPHHKDRQQLRNAEVLAAVGAAVVVEQDALNVGDLRDLVAELLDTPGRLAAMGAAARTVGHRDATARILADMGFAARAESPRAEWGGQASVAASGRIVPVRGATGGVA